MECERLRKSSGTLECPDDVIHDHESNKPGDSDGDVNDGDHDYEDNNDDIQYDDDDGNSDDFCHVTIRTQTAEI